MIECAEVLKKKKKKIAMVFHVFYYHDLCLFIHCTTSLIQRSEHYFITLTIYTHAPCT